MQDRVGHTEEKAMNLEQMNESFWSGLFEMGAQTYIIILNFLLHPAEKTMAKQ